MWCVACLPSTSLLLGINVVNRFIYTSMGLKKSPVISRRVFFTFLLLWTVFLIPHLFHVSLHLLSSTYGSAGRVKVFGCFPLHFVYVFIFFYPFLLTSYSSLRIRLYHSTYIIISGSSKSIQVSTSCHTSTHIIRHGIQMYDKLFTTGCLPVRVFR